MVIPKALTIKVLELLHDQHPGMSRMKALAREHVWWPNLDAEIECVVRTCEVCQTIQNDVQVVPLKPWPVCTRPFERVHIDFASKDGVNLLVLVDSYSKWIEVTPMLTMTAEKTIERLGIIFAQFGLPETIVTDNGPQFISEEFKAFARMRGIMHKTIPPYHAASNGLAEKSVQTVKKYLLKSVLDDRRNNSTRSVQTRLSDALLQYRITPHSVTGIAPSKLFLGRTLRTKLTQLQPQEPLNIKERASILPRTVSEEKQRNMKRRADKRRGEERKFRVGDLVWVKNVRGKEVAWSEGKIIRVISAVTYLADVVGKIRFVHADHLRNRELTRTATSWSRREQSQSRNSTALEDFTSTDDKESGNDGPIEQSVPEDQTVVQDDDVEGYETCDEVVDFPSTRGRCNAEKPKRLTYEKLGSPT